jgi:hypothetical protein
MDSVTCITAWIASPRQLPSSPETDERKSSCITHGVLHGAHELSGAAQVGLVEVALAQDRLEHPDHHVGGGVDAREPVGDPQLRQLAEQALSGEPAGVAVLMVVARTAAVKARPVLRRVAAVEEDPHGRLPRQPGHLRETASSHSERVSHCWSFTRYVPPQGPRKRPRPRPLLRSRLRSP